MMDRSTFLKSLIALTAAGAVPRPARAATSYRVMIPSNPGGGWDTTARLFGRSLVESGGATAVVYENKGGGSGTIGLSQFANSSKGDPASLMIMGAVMLGGLLTSKSPVNLSQVTPLVRLTSEYNVFVLSPDSPFKSMQEVIQQFKQNPASVKWGGGSRGSTEHIAAAMIAREVGVPPSKINYVAFRGGGEATAAILGGNVTVGGSGYGEFAEYIGSGKMRAVAVTSGARLKGVDIPTLRELGIPVEIGNWRGLYAGPGLTAAQRDMLIRTIVRATEHPSWQDALQRNGWTPALLTGDEFGTFVVREFANLRDTMSQTGMI